MNAIDELIDAIQKYFNLMVCNIANFADVFGPAAQLHGYRDGKMVCWPAAEYKEVLKARQSPLSLGSPRQDSVLLNHKIDGRWVITPKGYHLMRTV
jgi:hypothetical protein